MPTATTPKPAADSAANDWKPELRDVPIEAIDMVDNVRAGAGDVTDLRDSIKAHGVISPIRVESAGTRDGTAHYALVYGQRRLEAARAAGLTTIPALVDAENRTGSSLVVTQLIENLQREDLNALDTARAYRTLLDSGMTQRQLAGELGIAQPTIANTLALLKAPEELQARVAAGELTRSHVEAIVKLPRAEQAEVARRVVEHKLSTRDVEEEITRAAERQAQADRARDERRALADASEAALAKKKRGGTKETAILFSYDPQLNHELKLRGWTVLDERPGYYGAPAGCDCPGWAIVWNYTGAKQDSVTVTAQCIKPAHIKAANDAAEEQRAKQRAEFEAKHAAEATARAETVEAAVVAVTADADLRNRLVLLALIEHMGNWDEDVIAFLDSVTTDDDEGTSTRDLVGRLDREVVEAGALRLLAVSAIDTGIELATPPASKPAKRSKVKG